MKTEPPRRNTRLGPSTKTTSWLVAVAGALLLLVLFVGHRHAAPPSRCPDGLVAHGGRCCAPGQLAKSGKCIGKPKGCPAGFSLREQGCVARPSLVPIPSATIRIGPGDWEAQGQVVARDVVVASPFRIDALEVTFDRYAACVAAHACEPTAHDGEPGQPVAGVTLSQAIAFCHWAGGTLPSEDQWIVASAGPRARRYPWGDSGAVCRRANWGTLAGPCAHGARGPDWAGAIELDRTSEGVLGLSGGVSEWVRATEPGVVRGGSYRSQLASQLRTWWRETRDPERGYEDVGFRCVYP